jgi:hypothetical protein
VFSQQPKSGWHIWITKFIDENEEGTIKVNVDD